MKKLQVSIAEEEFVKYGLKSHDIDFGELVKQIKLNTAREALLKSQASARNAGLDKMTHDEIEAEIQAVREYPNCYSNRILGKT